MLVCRKVTYAMYPNGTQDGALHETLALHCRVTNTLQEEHRRRHQAEEPSFTLSAMCRALTQWREQVEALESLNAQSLQVTAKRVSLAFGAFFRRVAAGDTPGYPRFKALRRFAGWGYKTHGDGWKLLRQNDKVSVGKGCTGHSYGAVRLSGIGTVPLRGKARFEGTPKTAEVMRRGKKWVLSVTFKVEAEQLKRPPCGTESVAFDWGLKTLLTQVIGEPMAGPIEAVDNPRWLKRVLERIVVVQKDVSALETLAKAQSGKAIGFPVNARLGALYDRMRRLHGKIARQRNDFYHQLTAAMVKRFGLIVTEKLTVKNMVKAPRAKPDPANPGEFLPNGAARKAGLNRSIHDAAPAGLIMKLRCKAEEAGAKFMVLPTLKLKPTQRCHVCGTAQKRELSERSWRCACGAQHDRDANAARTMLRYAFEGAWWDTKQRAGTAQAAGRLVPS